MIYFLFFAAAFTFYFEEEVKKCAFELYKFIEFIHKNNPLLLQYYDCKNEYLEFYEQDESKETETEKDRAKEYEKQVELYENKYLDIFKNFTNEYSFNENDLKYEKKKFDDLLDYNKYLISLFEKQLLDHISKLNELVSSELELLKKYPNGEMETINDENDDTEFNEKTWDDYEKICNLREKNVNEKNKLEKTLNKLKKIREITEEQLKEQAHVDMIDYKLDGFINNYIIEYSPVGNVIMRFNNDKKSFEYYSNNSIPYRYLEPIGRKYVLTYKCKDIFIDMDEEVEKVNKVNEMKKNEQKNNVMNKNKNNKPITKLQPLTNKNVEIPPNRSSQSIINPINNIEMAIKDSNRYTWEGRIADFKIIKSDKKSNGNNISFKEFKRRQRE